MIINHNNVVCKTKCICTIILIEFLLAIDFSGCSGIFEGISYKMLLFLTYFLHNSKQNFEVPTIFFSNEFTCTRDLILLQPVTAGTTKNFRDKCLR